MLALTSGNITEILHILKMKMMGAPPVRTERWQGVAANTDTFELQNVAFEMDLAGAEDLDHFRFLIKPNLPWADDHFLERVGGEPLNPGEQWKHWPWGQSARNFKTDRFNHTYMERMWPKFARRTDDGKLPDADGLRRYPAKDRRPRHGIVQPLGDLRDWVEYLADEPHNRQHCIGIWFPEDVGRGDGGRKPCSMYWQVMVRGGRLCMHYSMRSADLRRHFPDDVYMAVRLLLWALDQCRGRRPEFWAGVRPGSLFVTVSSLHIFANDHRELKENKW